MGSEAVKKDYYVEKESCYGSPCRCCECQVIHCLLPHPGHSHSRLFSDGLVSVWFSLDEEFRQHREQQERINRLREACDL
jgi:hypothetical protein